jgi:hypothetical protein
MSALPLKVDIKRGGSHVRYRLTVRKSSPGNFGLLQHNLPTTDIKMALPNH